MKIIGSGTWEHLGFQSVRFLIFNQAYDAGLKGFKDFGGHSVHHPARLAFRPRSRPGAGEIWRAARQRARAAAAPNQNVAWALIGGQADAAVQTAANVYALVNKNQAHLLGWVSDELPLAQSEGTFTTTKWQTIIPIS